MNLGLGLSLGARGAGFSPAALFSAGEQGVWYDPSDLSTLFQDSAGTTPVTAVGQPVGFLGDKSRGFVPGAELVTNGTFDADTNGWTQIGGGSFAWDASGGIACTDVGGADCNAQTTITTVAGRTYRARWTVRSATGGWLFRIRNATDYSFQSVIAATGTYTAYFVASVTGTNTVNLISNDTNQTVVFDNISVRELAGNHATQPTAASRPVLGRVPVGGRRNLLTFTEQFDDAAWDKTSQGSGAVPTITQNAGTAPDGTTTAERVQFSRTGTTVTDRSRLEQINIPAVASTNYTFSIWLKSFGGANQTVTLLPNFGDGIPTAVTVTSEWQRFTLTANTLAGVTATVVVGLGYVANAVTAADILIWGAQLETGSTATAYQRVVTALDVTQAGVPDCYYLSFDGTDDGMLTGTITPGIDKVQVFAGVRKLSDAATGLVAETSTDAAANNGAFGLFAPSASGGNSYRCTSRGTAPASAGTGVFAAAPDTSVITGIGDIASDTATLRRNGAVVETVATDQGTGNYLAYPLYIGRRTASVPFNGQIFSLIVRFGANLPAATITQSEAFVNSKTGAY